MLNVNALAGAQPILAAYTEKVKDSIILSFLEKLAPELEIRAEKYSSEGKPLCYIAYVDCLLAPDDLGLNKQTAAENVLARISLHGKPAAIVVGNTRMVGEAGAQVLVISQASVDEILTLIYERVVVKEQPYRQLYSTSPMEELLELKLGRQVEYLKNGSLGVVQAEVENKPGL